MMFDCVEFLEGLVVPLRDLAVTIKQKESNVGKPKARYIGEESKLQNRDSCPKCHVGILCLHTLFNQVPTAIYCPDCRWSEPTVDTEVEQAATEAAEFIGSHLPVDPITIKGWSREQPPLYDPGKDHVLEVKEDGSQTLNTLSDWISAQPSQRYPSEGEVAEHGVTEEEMLLEKMQWRPQAPVTFAQKDLRSAANFILQADMQGIRMNPETIQQARLAHIKERIEAFAGKPIPWKEAEEFLKLADKVGYDPLGNVGMRRPMYVKYEEFAQAYNPKNAELAKAFNAGKIEMKDREVHPTGAQRSTDTNGLGFSMLSPFSLLTAAGVMSEGAAKYNRGNYLKGFPFSVLIDHLFCHLCMWMAGDDSEDHLGHAQWNLDRLVEFQHTRPDLDDRLDYGVSPERIRELKEKLRFSEKQVNEPKPEPEEVGSFCPPVSFPDKLRQFLSDGTGVRFTSFTGPGVGNRRNRETHVGAGHPGQPEGAEGNAPGGDGDSVREREPATTGDCGSPESDADDGDIESDLPG